MPQSKPWNQLTARWNDLSSGYGIKTYPANDPKSQIDFIFASNNLKLKILSISTPYAQMSSDHQPLFATIQLKE